MNKYIVFGYAVGGMAKFKDDIEAANTRQAISKAYDLHNEKYTLYKVFNESGILMADNQRISNRQKARKTNVI